MTACLDCQATYPIKCRTCNPPKSKEYNAKFDRLKQVEDALKILWASPDFMSTYGSNRRRDLIEERTCLRKDLGLY